MVIITESQLKIISSPPKHINAFQLVSNFLILSIIIVKV